MTENKLQVKLYGFPVRNDVTSDDRIREAVQAYLGSEGAAVAVARTDRGKPYLPKYPHIWISVSHSGPYCVCAVAETPIGVDLQIHEWREYLSREGLEERFCKMAKRFFHPVEADCVERNPYDSFFGIWSARESYVKYTGQGIDRDFSELCVIPEQVTEQPTFGGEEPVCWQALGVWFWQWHYGENDTLCVCAEQPIDCEILRMTE